MSIRLKAMGQKNYFNGFNLTIHEDSLDIPLHWRKPLNIFVNSMSDLFHEEVPLDFIKCVFDVMKKAHWHNFQILTKRSERLLELSPQLDWSSNIWIGVSVENEEFINRINDLRKTNARIKFLSIEPMLGPLNSLNLEGIDWVIVGGESGPCARPMNPLWVTDLRDQCQAAGVPFFFKQWGGVIKKKAGRQLDGRTWNEMPSRNEQEKNNKSIKEMSLTP